MPIDRKTLTEIGVATSITAHRTANRLLICRVVSGASAGQEVAVGGRTVIVGADPTCDVILQDEKVSRQHAELTARPDGLFVRDLDSTNGTFVDAVRVKECTAPTDSSIRCGDTTLRFSAAPRPTVRPSKRERFGGLVGDSLALRELFAVLELAGPTEATVLIEGESGTGKELAARALHDHSARADRPFVVVDCSASGEELLESKLFGHRVGAFTGAVSDRKGKFIEAHGGTIFLDEIGELPLQAQARLLRVLEAKTIEPLGADLPVDVDVRVVAATHRDLLRMVEAGTFRFDLFHRLAVVHVSVPALRERLEDLPRLIRNFYEGRGVDPGPISGENLDRLRAHAWRGNVRELRNVLERSWVLGGGNAKFADLDLWLSTTGNDDPTETIDTTLPFKEARDRWMALFARRYLTALYERHGRNITKAAEQAEINRRYFRELLEQYDLK